MRLESQEKTKDQPVIKTEIAFFFIGVINLVNKLPASLWGKSTLKEICFDFRHFLEGYFNLINEKSEVNCLQL